jgi:para-aminobenzoate synthetase/4-amino-4-deoxychorismate lyase
MQVRPFQLIETMLFDGSSLPFLPFHLERLTSSAAYFDFTCDRDSIESQLRQLEASFPAGQRHRVRLLLNPNGRITLSHTAITADSSPLKVRISPHRTSSSDVLLRHKTTLRDIYDQQYAQAHNDGFDEVLFLNERGELTEGAISTLFLNLGGQLLTPPLASGVLPGILRRHILATHPEARERIVTIDDLRDANSVFVGNSVRGLRQVGQIEMHDPLLQPSNLLCP